MTKLGFIGAGNMGEAILRGVLKANMLSPHNVYIYDTNSQKVKALQAELGVLTAQSSFAMIAACDIILLAVKPFICQSVLEECKNAFADKAIISIVTGWDRERLAAFLPESTRILRVMPNTPCMVGEGMAALDMDHSLTDEELLFAQEIFNSIGQAVMVPSNLMDAVTGVSGSGPAYVYMFIEAMADAGVKAGFSRELAYRFAAQTVVGAGKMVLNSGKHPGELKDAVCSPRGTTIEAVSCLEHGGFRAAVMDAVDASVKKAQEIAK